MQINLYIFMCLLLDFFFFLPPDRGFMNELMFTSAQYYLAEMTGFFTAVFGQK